MAIGFAIVRLSRCSGEQIALMRRGQSAWMWKNLSTRSFNTGINADNTSSLKLCARLGVTPSQWTFVGCMDPTAFGTGKITW